MWNERYREQGFAYGKQPNDFLAESVSLLAPESNILCLAEGEGRNAVFLAALGHRVTAVDYSEVGLAKAHSLARERQVTIDTIVADLGDFIIEPDNYNVIVSIFCHLPPPLRKALHFQVCKGLRPGGVLILEGFSKEQIERNTGGPRNSDLLMDLDEIKQELSELTLNHASVLDREIHEGSYHNGLGSVIQIIGTRPA